MDKPKITFSFYNPLIDSDKRPELIASHNILVPTRIPWFVGRVTSQYIQFQVAAKEYPAPEGIIKINRENDGVCKVTIESGYAFTNAQVDVSPDNGYYPLDILTNVKFGKWTIQPSQQEIFFSVKYVGDPPATNTLKGNINLFFTVEYQKVT